MLKMNHVTGCPLRADGGYSKGLPIKDTYVQIGDGMRRVHGVLYEPVKFMAESRVGVIILHSDDDYSTFAIGPELAKTILREWLKLDYIDGPSTPKIKVITSLETANFR